VTGASWGVSAAGVIVWAACWLLLRHYHHLHDAAHPWAVRAAIAFSYVAGCAIALTALGGYVTAALGWMLGTAGGPHGNAGHAAVTIAAGALLVSAVVALIWRPLSQAAYLAAAVPFVLAVAGGHLHALLGIVPAPQVVEAISKWIGG